MGTIYAVVNQKGGVGKTTSTANLAAAFSERKRTVLVCDLDPQGGLTTSLGQDPDSFEQTMYQIFLEECEFSEVAISTKISNVRLVPANQDLSGAEVELFGEIGWDRILAGALHAIQDTYDVILLDCPPNLGVLTLSALAAANVALVPVQCEFLAMRAVKQLNKTIAKTKRRSNPGLQTLFFRTMYSKQTKHSREIFEEVEEHGGNMVLKNYVKRTIKFAESNTGGEPALIYAPNSDVASAYRGIVHEILQRDKEAAQDA